MEYINLDLIVVYTIHDKIPTRLINKESVTFAKGNCGANKLSSLTEFKASKVTRFP